MTEEEIYLDKIRLGAIIVEKELVLLELFNRLIKDIRLRPDIREILQDYPLYHYCWQNVSELYDFLEYDYSNKLEKKDRESIEEIMLKYKSLKAVTIDDLIKAITLVKKIMSLSKFHDLIRKMGLQGLDKVDKIYGLKNE